MGTAVLDALERVGEPEVYALVALAALAETTILADILVPGEVAMALAGVVVSRGGADLHTMILAAAIGATVGDSVSFFVGKKWGIPVICRLGVLRRTLAPPLHRARHFFLDYGAAAVFMGRFLGPLRGLVPVAAGIAGMPVRRFLVWNVAASIAWATTVITLGFLLGDVIAEVLKRAGTVLFVVGGVILVAVVIHRATRGPVHAAGTDDSAADAFCALDTPLLEPSATLNAA